MNMRVYKKHVRAAYPIVAYCGYCSLQYTLYFAPKIGHTEALRAGAVMYTKLPRTLR